jgi:predicted transcriptional regulator
MVLLEEIDQMLADWKVKLDLISQNLIDLCGLLTYQRLSGASGFSPVQLTGITKNKIDPALAALNELLQHFDLLSQTIAKAKSLRAAMPRFLGTDQKVQEIFDLLNQASIQLPVVITPLAQRELLTAAETTRKITPLQLLVAMVNTFQVVKETILAVDRIWSDLEPQLDLAEAEIANLQRQGESLGIIDLRELEISRQTLASLRDRIESDPLGTSTSFDEINRHIVKMRGDIEQFVQAKAKLQAGFTNAHTLLQQLITLNQEAIAAFAETQEKISDFPSLAPPLPLEQIEAMGQWLQRLETKLKEGLTSPVSIGLENFTAKVNEYIAIEKKAITANRLPIQTRQELRGRLDALKAKATAKGYAEDMQLAKLAEQAKQLLYTRPTPLKQAEETVKQYETMLNSKC